VTTDEPTWLLRTVRFSDGIAGRDLSVATASVGEPATMPGGTTMWIGTLSRVLWKAASTVGLVDSDTFLSRDGLAIAQSMTAVVTALLVGALFVAVARWIGIVPALVASALLATEPWVVALGAVLHTDALMALFGTIGLVMLAYAFGVPDIERQSAQPGWAAAFGGAALMASALTKVTGSGFLIGALVVAAWALWRDRRRATASESERALSPASAYSSVSRDAHAGDPERPPGTPLRLSAIAALGGVVIVPIAWPAVVVDPLFQVERLVASAGLSVESPTVFFRGDMARQFFLGEPVESPGWLYYPVALALRTSPWFFVLLVLGAPAVFCGAPLAAMPSSSPVRSWPSSS
jgi:hypothetical protein